MALHRHLDGDGPQPLTLWLSRMCEAFHCLPSAIEAEWQRTPIGFLEEIVEARAYEAGYRFYKANPSTKDRSEFVQLAKVHTFELVREQAKKKQQR